MSENNFATELPLVFNCQGEHLIGMLHTPDNPAPTGVLMLVGGPQYRVGSHRQFILLARFLAAAGIPTMRFDVRGMGDSSGTPRSFADIDDDIHSAIDQFFVSHPSLQRIVLWGLCDAASAALFYAYQDKRIQGLVLLNPWVFTEKGAAKTYLKHYYLRRLLNPDLWHKILTLKFDYTASLSSLWNMFKRAHQTTQTDKNSKIDNNLALPIRMRESLKQFAYPVLLILSGRDLVADEFKETVLNDIEWQSLLNAQRLTRIDFPEADHTFSTANWRDQVAVWTKSWIENSLGKSQANEYSAIG